jgi:hypothetical protein
MFVRPTFSGRDAPLEVLKNPKVFPDKEAPRETRDTDSSILAEFAEIAVMRNPNKYGMIPIDTTAVPQTVYPNPRVDMEEIQHIRPGYRGSRPTPTTAPLSASTKEAVLAGMAESEPSGGFTATQLSTFWHLTNSGSPTDTDPSPWERTLDARNGITPLPSDNLRKFLSTIKPSAAAATSRQEWEEFLSGFPEDVRIAAARGVASPAPGTSSSTRLTILANDPSKKVRFVVATSKETEPGTLVGLTRDRNPSVRIEAVWNTRTPRVAVERAAAKDKNERVRAHAKDALVKNR